VTRLWSVDPRRSHREHWPARSPEIEIELLRAPPRLARNFGPAAPPETNEPYQWDDQPVSVPLPSSPAPPPSAAVPLVSAPPAPTPSGGTIVMSITKNSFVKPSPSISRSGTT